MLKFSRREEGSDLGFPNLEVADIEYRKMKGHLSSMKLLINDTDDFEFCLNPVFTSTDHLHVPLKKMVTEKETEIHEELIFWSM